MNFKIVVIIGLFTILVITVSCKDNRVQKQSEVKEEISGILKKRTYAEISIKQNGNWEGRKYIGGSFENVSDLEVPKNHTDHSDFIRYEGPGWENSKVGYRLYLDWRNAIDIFGKKTDTLVLAKVGNKNSGSYHEEAPWGMDILKAGESLGIGGFGRFLNDSVAHFDEVEKTIVKIHNTEVSSKVGIKYSGWTTGEETIDLYSTFTIYPEDRFTEVKLFPSKEVEGLCTGMVKFDNIKLIQKKSEAGKWGYIATYGSQTIVNEQDKLGMAIFYNIDDVQEIKEGPYDHLIIFKPNKNEIKYYFLGAWAQEKGGIKEQIIFEEDLNSKLQILDIEGSLENKI